MNRLSLPEVTKQMLHRICRKQVRSWLCCWSVYQHSSLYSASLCPRGHLHLAWPESARGCRERGGIWGGACFAWLGIRAGFSRNPLFFSEIYLSGLSPSVSEKSWCWKWERQFPLLKPSTKMPNPVFWHLVILIFPWLLCDIPLHHVYVIAALMFTHTHTHIHSTYTCLESQIQKCLYTNSQ